MEEFKALCARFGYAESYTDLVPTDRSAVLAGWIRSPMCDVLDDMLPLKLEHVDAFTRMMQRYLADFAEASVMLEKENSGCYADVRDMAARRLASLILEGVQSTALKQINDVIEEVNQPATQAIDEDWLIDYARRAQELA